MNWLRRNRGDAAGVEPDAWPLARIYPGEYGAEGEIEIRQLTEPERSDASN